MEDWRPRPRTAVDLRGLPLDAEEGYLLSRLDGTTSLPELRALTGLAAERLHALLGHLVELGAVEAPDGPIATPRSAVPPRGSPVPPGTQAPSSASAQVQPPAGAPWPQTPTHTPAPPSPVPGGGPAPDRIAPVAAASDPGDHATLIPDVDGDPAPAPEDAEGPEVESRNLSARALFGQHLRHLDEVERSSRAAVAIDPELSAFCFDPLPSVARALLGNPRFTAAHARMLARFHHSPTGLEALSVRGALARDPVVERCLLRNPQLPGGAARRMLTPLRLLRLWLLHVDRELPELARKLAKEVLRSRFGTAPAEERVDLILRTDGRVLQALGGVAVDGRTASLMCQRSYRSPLLIQNLARWSACPVPLLVHLWNQPAVRQQQQLRQALLRHPNLPSELKRSG